VKAVSGSLIAPSLLVAIALAGIPLGRAAADGLHHPAVRAHRDDAGLPRAALFPSGALLDIQRDNVSQLSAIARETRSRVAAGEATRTDLAEVEARLAAARSALYATQAQYAADRASYLAIIGAPPAEIARKRAPARAPRR
jgi:hypothetical protein